MSKLHQNTFALTVSLSALFYICLPCFLIFIHKSSKLFHISLLRLHFVPPKFCIPSTSDIKWLFLLWKSSPNIFLWCEIIKSCCHDTFFPSLYPHFSFYCRCDVSFFSCSRHVCLDVCLHGGCAFSVLRILHFLCLSSRVKISEILSSTQPRANKKRRSYRAFS